MLLFGATISDEVKFLKDEYMNSPVTIQSETQVGAEKLEQYYYDVRPHEKFSLLVHLLKKNDHEAAIIFCSRRSTVELLSKNLKKQGFEVLMIHGKLTQSRRLKIMEQFNKDKTVLVASSVAARGLHIEDVSHIYNYDMSQDAEEYIHRIGRTARAGKEGIAITLLCPKDYEVFGKVLERYDIDPVQLKPDPHKRLPFETGRRPDGRGPRGGPRRSKGSPRRRRSAPRQQSRR